MATDHGNGFEASLADVVSAVSKALDCVSPAVVGHHLRVAGVAGAIADQIGVPPAERRHLLLAAALHDIGAFSVRERLDLMRFETEGPQAHALAGYRLLRSFPPFEKAAELVRFHHTPWEHGRGERRRGVEVPVGSHVLHLADRVSVLPVGGDDPAASADGVLRTVAAGSGRLFVPDLVEALRAAAAAPGFWKALAVPDDAALRRHEGGLGQVALGEPEFRGLVRLFWQIVDFRSRFTATHTSGVVAVADFLAPLAGVGGAEGRRVAMAAGLHDLGKLAVPSEILEKERPLARGERESILGHPLHGWRILERVPGLEEINRWANYHHERLDGTGYPFGIPGERIPLGSRIVAVADVFTALTEERPYRRGMSGREATDVLEGMAYGGALDRDLVQIISRNRDGAAYVRRLAQENAAERYAAFLEPSPQAALAHSAA